MTDPLFPELISIAPEPPAKPCSWPYFIVAYWPGGGYWAIKGGGLSFGDATSHGITNAIADLQARGWTHVTIMRLPLGGPWGCA